MKLKCLIVDDEPPAIRVIENYLLRLNNIEIVATASNAIEAMYFLQREEIDLVFLDINMPEITGIGLLKIIKDAPLVILTTAYSDYAIESYEYNVTDYLLKPIRFERFLMAIEKVNSLKCKNRTLSGTQTPGVNNFIEFKIEGQKKRVDHSEIWYLQSMGNYIKIFSEKSWFVVLQTTKEAEADLPKDKFVRIHKSYIVNVKKVTNFDSENVYLNLKKIPIGKTYKKHFVTFISQFG